jgi:hypothetical protein
MRKDPISIGDGVRGGKNFAQTHPFYLELGASGRLQSCHYRGSSTPEKSIFLKSNPYSKLIL